jgi:hypothetical protein
MLYIIRDATMNNAPDNQFLLTLIIKWKNFKTKNWS